MLVCLDRRLIGTDDHLLIEDESLVWTKEVPSHAWCLSGELKEDRSNCLDTAFVLEGVKCPVSIPSEFVSVARTVLGDSYGRIDIPWRKMMPSSQFKTFLKNSIKEVLRSIKDLNVDYFEKVWRPTNHVFRSLQPCHVDLDRLDELVSLETSDSQIKAIQSFRPQCGSTRTDPPVYDRLKTRTGRMTIDHGPQILTLKKTYRDLVDSVYRDGSIVSMDFTSLEARVAYLEMHDRLEHDDVYELVNKEQFKGLFPRDVVKSAVLCELFGMGAHGIAHKLGTDLDKAQVFADRIRTSFDLDGLTSKLRHVFVDEGFIRSRFGRRVEVPEMRVLVNSFVQSTGVDVSLLGFSALIERVASISSEIRPIFLLHDDIMFDCPNGLLQKLKELTHVDVTGYSVPFPIKFKVLNE